MFSARLLFNQELEPTLLVLRSADGSYRRYTCTRIAEKRETFTCNQCLYQIRKTGSPLSVPRIRMEDGVIKGNQFPDHHASCPASCLLEVRHQLA